MNKSAKRNTTATSARSRPTSCSAAARGGPACGADRGGGPVSSRPASTPCCRRRRHRSTRFGGLVQYCRYDVHSCRLRPATLTSES
jgi:hypothetical protein